LVEDEPREQSEWGLSAASVLALLMMLEPAAGCAKFDSPDGGDAPLTTVACSDSLSFSSILDWQLIVVPNTIQGGEPFRASLDGVAVFDESFLDEAQLRIFGGVKRVNLVELKATVHVRSGATATGPDPVLTPDENIYDYECALSPTACDPDHDLEGDPGARPNTDCEPQSALNPCGRFILLPIAADCSPGGICEGLKKNESQCKVNGFCITGDLPVELGADTARYTADSDGNVRFGWAEGEVTGATVQDSGPNEGTWILPEAIYEEPTGPVGLRVTVGGFPVAFECTMGVDSRGPLGVGSRDFLSSRTPDSALVSFPIEPGL
jgi:hypothetical protein